MCRCALLAVGVLALAACRSRSTSDRQATAKVDACVTAIDAAAEAQASGWASARERGVQPSNDETAATMVLACAVLYKRDGCRRAHEAMLPNQGSPAGKIRALVEACRDAYCVDLSPSPTLCREKDLSGMGPGALLPLWEELDNAIVRHDWEAASAPVLEARKRARVRVTAAFGTYVEAGSPPYQVGSATQTGNVLPGAIVIMLLADGTASVDGTKVASDDMVDALLLRLASRREPHTKALIRAEPKVPYGRVIGMMDRAILAHLEPEIR